SRANQVTTARLKRAPIIDQRAKRFSLAAEVGGPTTDHNGRRVIELFVLIPVQSATVNRDISRRGITVARDGVDARCLAQVHRAGTDRNRAAKCIDTCIGANAAADNSEVERSGAELCKSETRSR